MCFPTTELDPPCPRPGTASGAHVHPAPERKHQHKPARLRRPAEHVETTLAPVDFAQPVRIVVLGLVKDASPVFGQRLEDTVRPTPDSHA